jgi:hypothetical protein
MATYKFVGNNRYFSGICTSDLVFDNKDSSEKRLFCEESTCVSAKYSGIMPITTCRTEMLPTGYTDKIFEWGVEGGPWTTAIDYGGRFPYSPNEFIGPGGLGNVRPALDPSPTGNWYDVVITSRGAVLRFNGRPFSNEFDPEESGPTGYTALGGGGQFKIDPAGSLGARSFEPTKDEFNRCSVSAMKYDMPEISYYDVGVNPTLPASHDVTFPHAFLNCGVWMEPYDYFDQSDEANDFRKKWIVDAQPSMAAGGAKVPYGTGHPPMPPLSAFPEWNYNHVVVNSPGGYATGRVTANSRGAKVYHPLADTNNATKVIRGTTAGPEWHTGYRMQRYKQTANSAKLGAYGNTSNIQFAFRDIETRIKAHGYYAKWTLKSIAPVYFIITNITYQPTRLYYAWAVRAAVTINVTYHAFNASIHPVYNYEYGPTPSSSDPYNCNGGSSDYGGWNPPFERKVQYATTNCSPVFGSVPAATTGTHFAYGFLAGTAGWGFQYSHTGNASNDINNVLSLKSRKRINYYKLPMSWIGGTYVTDATQYSSPTVDPTYIAYQGQKFTSSYGRPSGTRISTSLPTTPNDFKLWRRKV